MTPLPANHDPTVDPLLYAVEADGHSIFYGADTATLPEDTWQGFHRFGLQFDLVILDHTYGPQEPGSDHLSARQLIAPAARMRDEGLLVEGARVLATHIAHEGNHQIVLCERGIRTFETTTRFTLDLSAVPALKQETHLPVIVDPSHAPGFFRLVPPLALAAITVGADGLIVEIHPDPEKALCDGPQALTPGRFARLMEELKPVAAAVGRSV